MSCHFRIFGKADSGWGEYFGGDCNAMAAAISGWTDIVFKIDSILYSNGMGTKIGADRRR